MIRDILRQCGYPESTLVLDAETFYDKDYTLSKLSTYEYVSDKRFELLGWAFKRDNELANFGIELPENIQWNNTTVIMQNARFDALILAVHNQLHPPFIIDVLDLAQHIEARWSNHLKDLCVRVGLPEKGKTSHLGSHRTDFTDQQWVDLIAYAKNDAEREYELFQLLLPKFSNPTFELEVARYTRNLFLKPTLHLNVERAEKLKEEMSSEVRKVFIQVHATEKEIRGNISFEMLLRKEMESEEPPMKINKKGKPILAIAQKDEGRKYLLAHPNEKVRQLIEARLAVKSWPLHIKRVDRLLSTFKRAKNRMPVPLRYYGAHTGRWSGCEGINLQNLPARGNQLITQIRNLIEAPRGHVLIIIDFSQIEARVLDWLAEQNDMVRAFAEGRQIYCEFASRVVGHRIRKPKKTDSETLAKWYGNYRQLGKIGILGCGYGMGVDRLLKYAKDTFGIDMDRSMGEKVIKTYRRTHAMVVLFWKKLETAFRLATQNASQPYLLGSYGLEFRREGNVTSIQLPSTRRLYYTGARVGGTTRYPELTMPNPGKTGSKTIHMWGGYFAENVVQAVSRDILAETVLKIEQLGVRVPLIVHDDLSIIVPEKEAEAYRAQVEDIARTPPIWAPNLPVDIDCTISRTYVKA